MILQRQIYQRLESWKEECHGTKALLIEGARRIGKSTICEEFGKHAYRSYLLIDFAVAPDEIKSYFEKYLHDLDTFFMLLSTYYRVSLFPRESLIIFDEIQLFPKAREAIKYLVKDGRYDYIETGSLISIRENIKNILIPSEERHIKMYPLNFEEFCDALGEGAIIGYIHSCFQKSEPLEKNLHEKAMLLFRQYMLVGGMPQSVVAYVENQKDFAAADREKRDILNLYRNDIKIDFLISNNSKLQYKLYPIEVKSGNRYSATSLKRFQEKYATRIGTSYIIHPRNLSFKEDIICIPPYMTICL